jgi:hypothetical protein
MPARHYHRRILQSYRRDNTTNTYLQTNTIVINEYNAELRKFQNYICDIIDIIKTSLDIKLIQNRVLEILNVTESKSEIDTLLDLIEENIFGIIHNVSDCISIDIIRCRFQYIRELTAKIPDGGDTCYNYNYQEIYTLIFHFIDSITKGIDLSVVIADIKNFKIILKDDSELIDTLNTIEYTIFDIIKNIKDCAPIDIIRCRIQYLRELIYSINCRI